jgi:hypothetical protein
MPAQASLYTPTGWRLVKGGPGARTPNTQRAIDPQGNNVSYGQYLNAQARQSGFSSHSDYRKQAGKVRAFRNYEKTTPGAKERLALGSPLLRELKELIIDNPTNPDVSPGGRLASLLEALGWREQGATYNVGDTP